MSKLPFILLLLLFISGGAMAFNLSSSAFNSGEFIPAKYTCDAENISPPLQWEDAPANTKSFVLIMDDPDAPNGTWDHWLIFNIPAQIHNFDENLASLPAGTNIGLNSWRRAEYGGPCPPQGIHRYFFKIYALDIILNVAAAPTKQILIAAMQGHILAETELMGKYQRKNN